MKKHAWLIGFLGVWILLTAFLGFGHVVILVSNLIAGFFLMLVGFARVNDKPWQGWTVGLLGFWLYVAAFLLDLHVGADLLANNLTVGLVTAVAGFAMLDRKRVNHATHPPSS